ncbi:MAG: hypothetical protein CMB99_01230 [Flavobacteriaceae bacterium]|nr:hypothetical protein [Flavobacteriaceae bacterium]
MSDGGYRLDKFAVQHRERGELAGDEVFVLVPGRDPAAVAALRAYAEATDDVSLAAHLQSWATLVDGGHGDMDAIDMRARILHQIPIWTGVLLKEVKEGRMQVATALQRIAGYAVNATLRAAGHSGLEPK